MYFSLIQKKVVFFTLTIAFCCFYAFYDSKMIYAIGFSAS
ncbi:hypothetical protein HMPREF3226_02812 [Prevotella corporis]|uniref:Uncharacterized protein n=1 Tax=Prevotella corporis TaxID=28128 RepID=A0A133PSW5_9BACT|nr:hypothetical protein HMPREF3226_02812 [Prevotella corporis]